MLFEPVYAFVVCVAALRELFSDFLLKVDFIVNPVSIFVFARFILTIQIFLGSRQCNSLCISFLIRRVFLELQENGICFQKDISSMFFLMGLIFISADASNIVSSFFFDKFYYE